MVVCVSGVAVCYCRSKSGAGSTNGGVMWKLEYDKRQIEETIDRIVKKTMNMDLTWDWPCGGSHVRHLLG